MAGASELTANWGRALIIDGSIDDELVRRLTPQILSLRQQSNEPITIGIDSPGGSLASLDVLLGLLTGPDQNGTTTPIVTVATHRAYSAAANFLAFGSYAVALRHSQILYHDVRFGGMEDVTPEKARDAARSLQDANDVFALRLAHRVIKRLVWGYIDLKGQFEDAKKRYPSTYKRYSTFTTTFAPRVEGFEGPDLAGFATCLWARLSSENDALIKSVMRRLARWINLTRIARTAPTYRPKGSRVGGLLDGARHLNKLLAGKAEHFESSEEGLKLLLSLLVAEIAGTKSERVNFSYVLEQAAREFGILDSMNDSKQEPAARI